MIARRKFNHTAAGLLGKFVSRNNDYQGYWALGVLYTEARASAMRVELDLLRVHALPEAPACVSVARSYATFLGSALAEHGLTPQALAAATVSIEFGLSLPQRPRYIPCGDPFVCSFRILSGDGREFTCRKTGYCLPHDQFAGIRSAR